MHTTRLTGASYHIYPFWRSSSVQQSIADAGFGCIGDLDEHPILGRLQSAKSWLHPYFSRTSTSASCLDDARLSGDLPAIVRAPKGFICSSPAEQHAAFLQIKQLNPASKIVIKPASGTGGYGLILDAQISDLPPIGGDEAAGSEVIVEEMVGGAGSPSPTVYMCGSEVIAIAEQLMSGTTYGGLVVPSKSIAEKTMQAMAEAAAAIGSHLGLTSHWGLDFVIDPNTQQPLVVDLNIGRPNGNMAYFLWRSAQVPPKLRLSQPELFQLILLRTAPQDETFDEFVAFLQEHGILWSNECASGILPATHVPGRWATVLCVSWEGHAAVQQLAARLQATDRRGTYETSCAAVSVPSLGNGNVCVTSAPLRNLCALLPATQLHTVTSRHLSMAMLMHATGSCEIGSSLATILSASTVAKLVTMPAIGWLQHSLPTQWLLCISVGLHIFAHLLLYTGAWPVLSSEVLRSISGNLLIATQNRALKEEFEHTNPTATAEQEVGFLGNVFAWADAVAAIVTFAVLFTLPFYLPASTLPVALAHFTTVVLCCSLLLVVQGGWCSTRALHNRDSGKGTPGLVAAIGKLMTSNPAVPVASVASACLSILWMMLFYEPSTDPSSCLPNIAVLGHGCDCNFAQQLSSNAWTYVAFLPGSVLSAWLLRKSNEAFLSFWLWMLLGACVGLTYLGVWLSTVADWPILKPLSAMFHLSRSNVYTVPCVIIYYLAKHLDTLSKSQVPTSLVGAYTTVSGVLAVCATGLTGLGVSGHRDAIAIATVAVLACCVVLLRPMLIAPAKSKYD